jgi:type IV secretion system protein VirB6
MEQGGVGLLMTMLIISAPPIAAQFFNGTLGSFMAYSAIGDGSARPGPQGQPAGSYAYGGGGGYGPSQANAGQSQVGNQTGTGGLNKTGLVQPRQTAAAEPGKRWQQLCS